MTFFCGASKGFMKALCSIPPENIRKPKGFEMFSGGIEHKAFIKPLEASQRSVKIEILVNLFTLSEIGTRRVKR